MSTDTLSVAQKLLIATLEETIRLQETIIKLQGDVIILRDNKIEQMNAAVIEKDKNRIDTLNIIHDLIQGIETVDMK